MSLPFPQNCIFYLFTLFGVYICYCFYTVIMAGTFYFLFIANFKPFIVKYICAIQIKFYLLL